MVTRAIYLYYIAYAFLFAVGKRVCKILFWHTMSLDRLPAEYAKKAREELNEDPETRLQKIEELRGRLKERADLPFDKTDKGLILFLRARKFDVDLAFELIVRFYEAKVEYADVYDNLTPSAEKKTFDSGWNVAFNDRDANGCRILAVRPGTWDPNERELVNNLRANIIAIEILIQEEITQICGIVMIIDFRNFGLTQAKAMQPLVFKRYGALVFNIYPMRIKGIHVLDQPAVFNIIYPIIAYFMKEKVKERLKLHGPNIDGLKEFIQPELLPSDYGGNGAPTDIRTWVKKVINAEEELEHLWY